MLRVLDFMSAKMKVQRGRNFKLYYVTIPSGVVNIEITDFFDGFTLTSYTEVNDRFYQNDPTIFIN